MGLKRSTERGNSSPSESPLQGPSPRRLPSFHILPDSRYRLISVISDVNPRSIHLYSSCAPMTTPKPSTISEASVKVVQAQLDAYNARDMDGWLATYSDDAEQFMLHGGSLAKGRPAIRKRMQERFRDPALHARLLHRTCMENVVVDHEMVTRTFPDGLATVEMVCVYDVQAGKILKATFAIGQARPLRRSAAP